MRVEVIKAIFALSIKLITSIGLKSILLNNLSFASNFPSRVVIERILQELYQIPSEQSLRIVRGISYPSSKLFYFQAEEKRK